MTWTGRALVSGSAAGPALVTGTPVSFLGDVDIRSGRIVETSSDICGVSIAGTVLVMPQCRGSAGAWRFLYQLFQHGTHPVALLTEEAPDPSVVQGAIMCAIPVVSGVARTLQRSGLGDGAVLAVDGASVTAAQEGQPGTGDAPFGPT